MRVQLWAALAPSKVVWETRCAGVTAWLDGRRVFHAAGRMHTPSGASLSLASSGPAYPAPCRIVHNALLEARRFPFVKWGTMREVWSENISQVILYE